MPIDLDLTPLKYYHGQTDMKKRLLLRVVSARKRTKPLDHILLTGPAGCGKTRLAHIIAELVGDEFTGITMPIDEPALARIIASFTGVLLLDEIHEAPRKSQDSLLTLLQSGFISRPNGQQIENDWLTIVGATTEPEKVTPALTNRFSWIPRFEPYSLPEMIQIVRTMALQVDVELSYSIMKVLAGASGGMPRNANALVKAARDIAIASPDDLSAENILDMCGVAVDGLTEFHIDYLNALETHAGIGSAGVDRLAAALRLHKSAVIDLERLLIEKKLIEIGNGRQLTTIGRRRLKETRNVRLG